MKITRYAKRDAIRFDQKWRPALRELEKGRTLGALALPIWHGRAKLGIQFVHDGGSTSGSVHFEEDETVPHPSELCEHLGFDWVWFFGIDFTWAVHAGHEDWDDAKLFEKPESSSAR